MEEAASSLQEKETITALQELGMNKIFQDCTDKLQVYREMYHLRKSVQMYILGKTRLTIKKQN